MTQSPIAPPSPDDIVVEDDSLTQRLNREADTLLAADERRTVGAKTSVRQAVKEDADQVRQKVAGQVDHARDSIRDEPIRATLYALGIGIIVGMLLRR